MALGSKMAAVQVHQRKKSKGKRPVEVVNVIVNGA